MGHLATSGEVNSINISEQLSVWIDRHTMLGHIITILTTQLIEYITSNAYDQAHDQAHDGGHQWTHVTF
jgi:hypothetical protein